MTEIVADALPAAPAVIPAGRARAATDRVEHRLDPRGGRFERRRDRRRG